MIREINAEELRERSAAGERNFAGVEVIRLEIVAGDAKPSIEI